MFSFFKNRKKETKSFWEIINLLDWKNEGNDDQVISPVINYLSNQSDEFIFNFEELLSEYLYAIDGKHWAESYKLGAGFYSDDGFLYCRCVAIINGENYYNSIKNGDTDLNGDLEFESILYVSRLAWAKKHNSQTESYPYLTKVSYESGSNAAMWR